MLCQLDLPNNSGTVVMGESVLSEAWRRYGQDDWWRGVKKVPPDKNTFTSHEKTEKYSERMVLCTAFWHSTTPTRHFLARTSSTMDQRTAPRRD